MAALPDVPTLAELGYRDMTKTAWIGLFGHTDVPAAVHQHVRDEAVGKTLRSVNYKPE